MGTGKPTRQSKALEATEPNRHREETIVRVVSPYICVQRRKTLLPRVVDWSGLGSVWIIAMHLGDVVSPWAKRTERLPARS